MTVATTTSTAQTTKPLMTDEELNQFFAEIEEDEMRMKNYSVNDYYEELYDHVNCQKPCCSN